VETNDLTWRV